MSAISYPTNLHPEVKQGLFCLTVAMGNIYANVSKMASKGNIYNDVKELYNRRHHRKADEDRKRKYFSHLWNSISTTVDIFYTLILSLEYNVRN